MRSYVTLVNFLDFKEKSTFLLVTEASRKVEFHYIKVIILMTNVIVVNKWNKIGIGHTGGFQGSL